MTGDFFDHELFDFIVARDGSTHIDIAAKFPDSQGLIGPALDRMESDARIYFDPIDGFKRK